MKTFTRFLSVAAATLFTALIASCGGGGGGGYTAPAPTMLDVATLKAGGYYFNVHTVNYPDGEIRGQITGFLPSDIGTVTRITALTGDQEVPPVAATGTGTGTLTINLDTGALVSASITVTLTNTVTFAHVHQGVAGVNGPIVVAVSVTGGGGGGGY